MMLYRLNIAEFKKKHGCVRRLDPRVANCVWSLSLISSKKPELRVARSVGKETKVVALSVVPQELFFPLCTDQ